MLPPRPAVWSAAAVGARSRRRPGQTPLALLLALVLAPGGALAGAPPGGGLSEGTGPIEASGDPGAEVAAPAPAEADAAARWTATAQQRRARGDLDGAIADWQQALASLPVTQATAHRRAGLALAIAAAHEEAAVRRGAPARLQAAIAVLDAYLAGLDPTDDENRVAVEQRRAELAAKVVRPRPEEPRPPPPRTRPDRRLLIAGGVGVGLGLAGLAVLGAGLAAGVRADEELAAAVELGGDDPAREPRKAAALARGLRANRTATVGGAVGGALLVLGVALLIAGATRKLPPRTSRWLPRGAPGGLRWRF